MKPEALNMRIEELEEENLLLKKEIEKLLSQQCRHNSTCEVRISPEHQHIHWDIIDSVPDFIFFKDKDYKYLGANSHYLEFVGLTLDELIGKSDFDIHQAEDAKELRAADERIINEKITEIQTKEFVSQDGKISQYEAQKSPLFDQDGEVYGIIGIAKDISGKSALEDKLQLTNEKLNEAQKIAKIGHWVWDIVEENLWWSDEIYRIFGFAPQQFGATYEAFLNTIHPEDRDTVNNATMTALEKKSKYNIFHRILLPNGTEKIVHEVGEGSYDKKGNPIQMIGTVQDVTEVKRIEQALEESLRSYKELNQELDRKVHEQTAQLLAQSRLAQMGEMISMIAHQWRQPLSSITAAVNAINIRLSLGKYDLSNKEGQAEFEAFLKERLQNIDTFANSLSTTIDDFRDFYKPNKESQNISIQYPLERSIEILKSMFNSSNITLLNKLNSKKILKLYTNELMQVILNIFKNAEDNFIEHDIKDRIITISSEDTPKGALLEICDNGGGIQEDIMQKIFDPYFSTKDMKNGTGLGLYMSKIIVEDHHKGKLSVKNNTQGACFTIEIFDN